MWIGRSIHDCLFRCPASSRRVPVSPMRPFPPARTEVSCSPLLSLPYLAGLFLLDSFSLLPAVSQYFCFSTAPRELLLIRNHLSLLACCYQHLADHFVPRFFLSVSRCPRGSILFLHLGLLCCFGELLELHHRPGRHSSVGTAVSEGAHLIPLQLRPSPLGPDLGLGIPPMTLR